MKKIRYLFVMVFVIILCSCMNDPNDKKLEILQEATQQWQEFVNSNQLTITADFTVSLKLETEDASLGSETGQTKVKLCKSPFYMETKENDEILVIQEEQGELYKYTFPVSPGMVYVNKSLVEDIDYIGNITEDYYTEDPFSGIDIKHIGVAYNQNIYTFRINVNDYLQGAGATEETKNIIASLGGDANMLENSWLTISMSFSDVAAYMKVEMEFRHEGLVVLIELDTKLDNREIFKVDFNDPKYFVAPPSDIEDVHQFSNVGEIINMPMYGTNYFKFNLEKGQYGLYASLLDEESNSDFDDWTVNNIALKLYDENFKEIPIGMGLSAYATAFPQRTFYISEPGIYYLSAQSNISTEMKISINQLDYKTIGFENTQEFTSGKGTIEGEYDFDVYTLEAEEDGLILFKNIGESPIYLIYCEYISNGSPHITYKKIIDEAYIRLGAGENKFIVCSNFKFNQQPLEYEFTTERIKLENGYEESYENLKKVTTEFSELTYISGYGFSYPRLALEVETKSIICFQFEAEMDLSTGAAVVKDLEGNVITSTQYNTFELEPGKYIVEVYSSDHVLCMTYIKYTALEIEDMEVNVSLKEGDLSQIFSPDFPYEISKNVGRTQVVKYNFELKEDSLIAYSEEIQIFKKDGSLIFDFDDSIYYNPFKLLYLSQGQYYFISKYPYGSYYGNDTRSYKIGIVQDQLDTVFNLDQMTEIVIGQELFLKKDWEYDMEYLVLYVLEDGEYQFNLNLNVYDENFEYYTSTSTNWSTQFAAGTYYLKYNYAYSHFEEISILVKLITDEILFS